MEPFWSELPALINIIVGLVIGFGVSIGFGRWYVPRFFEDWKRKLPPLVEAEPNMRLPPKLTGQIERAAFTAFVIVQPTVSLAAMMGWLGLKMAANWNKDVLPKNSDDEENKKVFRNRHAFLGLVTGFVSLTIAWVGGMLARLIMGLD